MASIILLFVSLLGFSFVARGLGKTILSRRHHFPYRTGYSFVALKLERTYKITAYLFLAVVMFAVLVQSFLQVLSGNPF